MSDQATPVPIAQTPVSDQDESAEPESSPKRAKRMPEQYVTFMKTFLTDNPTAKPAVVLDSVQVHFCDSGEPADWPGAKRIKNKVHNIKKALRSGK